MILKILSALTCFGCGAFCGVLASAAALAGWWYWA